MTRTQEDLTKDIEELDEMLREALLHIFNLLVLVDSPGNVTKHMYFKGAEQFYETARDGLCTSIVETDDGNKVLCPNEAYPDQHFCTRCLLGAQTSLAGWVHIAGVLNE